MTDKIKDMIQKLKPVLNNIINKIKSKYQVIREFSKKTYNKHCIYMYVTTAILLNLVIEMLARGSFIKGIYFLIASPYVFLCNSIIILMTLSITFLMRRRFWGLSMISFIWLLSGVTNSILLSNRVTPFTATDLMLVDSAFGIVTKYFSIAQIVMVSVGVTLAIALLVLLFFKAPKVQHKIKYPRNIIAIIIIWTIGFGSINLGVGSELMSMKFGELRVSYYDYGFVYCFTNSLINTGIAKPNNYSGETVEKIVDKKETKYYFLTARVFF